MERLFSHFRGHKVTLQKQSPACSKVKELEPGLSIWLKTPTYKTQRQTTWTAYTEDNLIISATYDNKKTASTLHLVRQHSRSLINGKMSRDAFKESWSSTGDINLCFTLCFTVLRHTDCRLHLSKLSDVSVSRCPIFYFYFCFYFFSFGLTNITFDGEPW